MYTHQNYIDNNGFSLETITGRVIEGCQLSDGGWDLELFGTDSNGCCDLLDWTLDTEPMDVHDAILKAEADFEEVTRGLNWRK